MDNPWAKISVFVLLVIALAWGTMRLLTPPIGGPVEANRIRHPEGFSIVHPVDWEAMVNLSDAGGVKQASVRMWPRQQQGRPASFVVIRYTPGHHQPYDNAVPSTFQGEPAQVFEGMEKRDWIWVGDFQRDQAWFRIVVRLPVRDDIGTGAWRAFIDSFRLEAPTSTAPVNVNLATQPTAPVLPAK